MNTNTSFRIMLATFLAVLIPIYTPTNSGDLYVTDNSSIRIYAPDGTTHIFASGLLRPRGLAFDGSGNLFVATLDTVTFFDNRGQILKFAPDGTATVFVSELDTPEELAFDGAGNLYVVSNGLSASQGQALAPGNAHLPGRVTKITPKGTRSEIIFDPSTFHQNFGIAIDKQNNLFVADNLQGKIYKLTPDRQTSTFVNLFDPIGLAFDGAGNLYASSQFAGGITRIAPDGTQTLVVSGLGAMRGLAFDSDGNLFVAGRDDNVIFKITPDKSVSIFASGLDGPQFLAVAP